MNAIERLAAHLKHLDSELHDAGKIHIRFNQQRVSKGNMSFSGGNGRIWMQPVANHYDLSLSGKALIAEMSSDMNLICGRACIGYKQTNKKLAKQDQPYWRVQDFKLVRAAVDRYSKPRA